MMAAYAALQHGADVTIYEHTDRLGKKLSITGKGRCNVTNDCTPNEFMENVIENPKFLYTALYTFKCDDTIAFFEGMGVPLKTERGRRVFPVSDKAADIVNAMKKSVSDAKIIYESITNITVENGAVASVIGKKESFYDAVIIATGGCSYPLTGSDGSGYKIAKRLGHTVTPITPSLVPIEAFDSDCKAMQGLALKNTGVKITDKNGKTVYEDFGELLFTHFGVSGPTVLSASSHLRDYDISELTLVLDLKPALTEKELDARILSDFSRAENKNFENSLGALLPNKMIDVVVRRCGIDRYKKVNSVTKEERKRLLDTLKHFEIHLKKFRPISEAIVTSGGIDVKEINPKSMMSTKIKGLYFAGEIIDVDAYTGGYNLQIAFSTGYLAGKSASTDL